MTKTEGGVSYQKGAYLIASDPQEPSSWKLRVKDENGQPDSSLMCATWAALHDGFRGVKFQGAGKLAAIAKLKKLYEAEDMTLPIEIKADSLQDQIDAIRGAFYTEYTSAPTPSNNNLYVEDVFLDYVIVCDYTDKKKYKVGFSQSDGETVFKEKGKWVEVVEEYVEVKTADMVACYGSEVKAMGNGKVGGYLITFGDEKNTDISQLKDFFQSDTDFGTASSSSVLYNHGLDVRMGMKTIGEGTIRKDEVGIWIESQLEMRDAYEKAIYAMAEAGKLGWSSGTAPHLVRRKKIGNAHKILSWPLGLDASLTPTPAEPRNSVLAVKSLQATELHIEAESPQTTGKVKENQTMPDETKTTDMMASVIEKVQGEIQQQNAVKAAEAKRQQEMEESVKNLVLEAMKTAPAIKGGAASPSFQIDSKKNEVKAFWNYVRTGDRAPYIKAAVDLNEGDAEQGGVLVPDDFYPKIVAKRDEISIARGAGSTVIQTSLKTVDIPIEGVREAKFVAPGEKSAYDENAVEPFDVVTATIVKYTRLVKISEELLSDQAANLESFLADRLGRAAGITENDIFLTGASTLGAVTTSGLGATAPSNAAISAANIMDLYYALSQPYRQGASWVMRGATEGYVRKLTSAVFTFGQTPQGQVGQTGFDWLVSPSSRVFNSDEMDAIGSAAKSILFANWSYYYIVERAGLVIRRLNELYAGTGQVGILASFRVGGAVTQSEAFKHLLHPTTT